MPNPGVYSLRQFNGGVEATKGTAVPATWALVGDTIATPQIMRYMSDYPRGVMVPVTGGGTPIQQGTSFVQNSDLSFEELWYALNLSMATPTVAGGAADKTWTYAPIIVGDPLIKTATFEWALADGSSTAFGFPGATGFPVTMQTSFCFCAGFDLNWAMNAIATAVYRYTGRATTFAAGSVPTAAMTVLTGRERVSGNQFKVYLDTTWAGLGGTQLSGTVRSGKLTFTPGIEPDYTTDGRPQQDFTQLRYGKDRFFTLQLVMEMNATSAAEIKAWIAQNAGGSALSPNASGGGANVSPRFVRIEATSPNTLGGSNRRLRIDNSFVYTKEPVFSQTDKAELVTMELKSEYDPTSAKAYQAAIVNSLASIT